MKANAYTITEFYKQLSLLIRSELPLSDSLAQLAFTLDQKPFRFIVKQLAESTEKGLTLAQAMEQSDYEFEPFHIKMIGVGENSNTLSEVLQELAKTATLNYKLSAMLKDVVFYPAATITFAMFVLFIICYAVIPQFKRVFEELLEGEPLPELTELVIWLSDMIRHYTPFMVLLYAAFIGFVLFLLLEKKYSFILLLKLIQHIPYASIIFYNLGMARICRMLAVTMRQKMATGDSLAMIAELVDYPELKYAMIGVSQNCRQGMPLQDAVEREESLSRILAFTMRRTPEQRLPDELDALVTLFHERAWYGFRKTGMAWQIMTFMGMFVISGLVIIAIFIPFICLLF